MSAMTTATPSKVVQCPTCKKPVPWVQDQHYRPFCSERCKLIDLGDWASEGHRIQGRQAPTDDYNLDNNQGDY